MVRIAGTTNERLTTVGKRHVKPHYVMCYDATPIRNEYV